MNDLSPHSNSSFEGPESHRTPSIAITVTTDTSTNTVSGLGTLSGRVAFGLGKAVIRRADNLVVRRKLGIIMSVYPHDDDTAPENIGTLYDDLLELSRRDFYSAQIRKQALRVLLVQIKNRQTCYLIRHLVKWPSIEVEIFLSEIIACMPPEWLPPGNSANEIHQELAYADVFLQGSNPPNYSALSLLSFFVNLAKTGVTTCRAVLRAGFLDVLLCMYACNFVRTTHTPIGIHDVLRPEILESGSNALTLLSRKHDIQAIVDAHPICVLWPKSELRLSMLESYSADRRARWRQLSPVTVAQRLSSLGVLLRPPVIIKNYDLAELTDAYVDLIEFSMDRIYELSIALKSKTLLSECNWDNLSILPQETPSAKSSTIDDVATTIPPVRGDTLIELLERGAPLQDVDLVDPRYSPWFLRSQYGQNEILIHFDGSVKGGTVWALVRRLTAHDYSDSTFIKTFMATWMSFVDVDELFDLLVQRFYIQPPGGLKHEELETWKKLKQHPIQMRVLNILRSIVAGEEVFEKDDILHRMRDFVTRDEVYHFAAAKVLLTLIERYEKWDRSVRAQVVTSLISPPASIHPKNSNLGLLDIDTLELARQLTILASLQYMSVKPMECLERSSEVQVDYNNSISRITRHFNQVANWVENSVMSQNRSRKEADVIKYFISVAHNCRGIHNFSTMVAIFSGLNATTVRGLKQSWKRVDIRLMRQLNDCEAMIDPGKNFTDYSRLLAVTSPPCVPYFGVYLRMLKLLQRGSRDTLPNNLVNFRKRRKVCEIIDDIKRWQLQPHNFHPIESVFNFVEESLSTCSEWPDVGERLWNTTLRQELLEEEEKMVRLLEKCGT